MTGGSSSYDVVVIGAGFAGMYMVHKAREIGLTVRAFEAGSGVGGTWYWNRYPGARCDVESMQYSYQFSDELQQEWEWTERYAAQPEILRYANHVADRFDLRPYIQFDARVKSALFDDPIGRWLIEVDDGTQVWASFCISAMGCLSTASLPNVKGLQSFKGECYHTGQWPHEGVDFTGKRVGVIGTGSSGIQAIPHLAAQAAHLVVFQRTPNYVVPAHNGPLDLDVQNRVKAEYGRLRAIAKQTPGALLMQVNAQSALEATAEERQREYEKRWGLGGLAFLGTYADLLVDTKANDTVAEFVRTKIRETVQDPQVAAMLSPRYVMGCKRVCVDTGFWNTFNRPNVTLIDIGASPIQEITANGLKAGGEEYALDAIVFATGFDAMTGALLKVDIRGRGGFQLKDKWAEGARTYLGLGIAGFPNFFTITGPGSPSVLTNMIPSIEQHVEWIAACLEYMRDHGFSQIEPSPEAEEAWVAHAREVVDVSLRSTCSSWYLGANIPGKPRVYLPYAGGFHVYVQKCEDVAAGGYEGFRLGKKTLSGAAD